MARRQKKQQEKNLNHDRWLVSYADFITLLFAFFVVMYSVSSVNEGKFRVLSDTLSAAFNEPSKSLKPIQIGQISRSLSPENIGSVITESTGKLQVPTKLPRNVIDGSERESGRIGIAGAGQGLTKQQTSAGEPGQLMLDEMNEQIENVMASLIDQSLMSLRRHKSALEIELKSNILFGDGNARLSIRAEKILIRLASVLAKFPNSIQVEGHTDDIAISTARYPSNWELSSARASAIANLFTEQGVDPEYLWAVGYAQYRPKVDNVSAATRQENRRVIIMIRPSTTKSGEADSRASVGGRQ